MSLIIKDVTCVEVAKLIADRNIVALFQGRSEAGHRALGNRSILYDPRDPNGKDHVNIVKQRESYRPFAASVMLDYAHEWFDMAGLKESPYMMYAVDVKENKKNLIPCVTHVDGTCRIQTVTEKQNFNFYNVINELSDGAQRVNRVEFNLTVKAYLLPEKFDGERTTTKGFSSNKLINGQFRDNN